MSFMEEALTAAAKCPEKHDFKVGDKIRILHRDYIDEIAVVRGLSENLLGKPLLDVDIDYGRDGILKGLCFYPDEVEHYVPQSLTEQKGKLCHT
jgi:hypothetical protein|tara:strand:- start:66 stop:347 length:282 start_codon:yes stop_codon:yes gene_type:complete